MNIHTVADILRFPNETPLEGIEGTITAVYPRKAGTTQQNKPWSFQDATFADATGAIIKLKFVGCEDFSSSWKSRRVRITSVKSDRGRTGLYALDDEYNGNVTRKIKVTPSHTIVDLAESRPVQGLSEAVDQRLASSQQAPQYSPPPQEQRREAPQHTQPAGPSHHAAPPATGIDAGPLIARIAGLQAKCYDAAVWNAHGIMERHGIALMPGAVGIMGDKIFMEVIRRIEPSMLPMNPYKAAPFRGKPLDELLPAMRQQIAEGKAEIDFGANEERQRLGAQSLAQQAATPPPVQEPVDDDTMPF